MWKREVASWEGLNTSHLPKVFTPISVVFITFGGVYGNVDEVSFEEWIFGGGLKDWCRGSGWDGHGQKYVGVISLRLSTLSYQQINPNEGVDELNEHTPYSFPPYYSFLIS